MLDPKDARVCILEEDVPDLAGIARVGVNMSRTGRGHAKGVVGLVKDAPKIPRNKAPPGNASRARDEAYPCKCKYPTSVEEAARARKANVHWFCDRVSLHCIADPSHISR